MLKFIEPEAFLDAVHSVHKVVDTVRKTVDILDIAVA